MRYLIIIALPLLLAGCESGCVTRSCEQNYYAGKQAERDQRAEVKDHGTCAGYGLERGQPQYADCRLRLAQMRNQSEASRRAAIMQWYGAQQQRQPVYTPAPAPLNKTPTYTNCQWISGIYSCTSY